jgi:hypothetical protein
MMMSRRDAAGTTTTNPDLQLLISLLLVLGGIQSPDRLNDTMMINQLERED